MANLADVVIEDTSNASLAGNSERARQALSDAVASGSPTATTGDTQPSTGSDADPLATVLSGDKIPEKFRGKTLADVLDSYGNVESRLGSMANELGVQRQLTDRLLDLKRHTDLDRNTPPAQRKPVQVTASEILDKPAETLDRVLSEREAAITQEVNRQVDGIRMSMAETAFRNKHSDFQSVVVDPSFVQWVQSSQIRMRAAAGANAGDWQLATELLDEYKNSRRSAAAAPTNTNGQENLEAARRATLESSTGGNGSDGVRKGKTYSRADLMRLRIEDPESYYDDGFQAEITKAYAEGRVR